MDKRWLMVAGAGSELAQAALNMLASDSKLALFALLRSRGPAAEHLEETWRGRLQLQYGDLEDPQYAESAARAIVACAGAPYAFLHFAAPRLQIRRAKEIPPADFQRAFSVQALSAAAMLRILLPEMKRAGGDGIVLFVLSEVVRGSPPKGMADYVVGKYAQLGLLRALSAEFESDRLKFRAIAPGMLDTKFLREVPELVSHAARAKGRGEVEAVARQIASLVHDPDALKGDALELR